MLPFSVFLLKKVKKIIRVGMLPRNCDIILKKVVILLKIELNDKELNVIYYSLDHLSKSTNILENYDLWHEDEMPKDSFAKDYYSLLNKLKKVNS
jgi:hypothetical protein